MFIIHLIQAFNYYKFFLKFYYLLNPIYKYHQLQIKKK